MLVCCQHTINIRARLTQVAEWIEQLCEPLLGHHRSDLRFRLQYAEQITLLGIRFMASGLDELMRLRSTKVRRKFKDDGFGHDHATRGIDIPAHALWIDLQTLDHSAQLRECRRTQRNHLGQGFPF